MGLLAPWFLAGLTALGLPVFVHLLRRHTTTPRPVSSLMFFEAGTQSSTKHRRLRYLLLFTLRTLLVLLLVLAFAQPFLRTTKVAASDKLLLLALDNSFSMQALNGAANKEIRLTQARQQALSLLAQRPGSQRAQILSLGGTLQVLTQPIQDQAALRTALEAIPATASHGNFGELGRGLRAMAETNHTPIELHLFSDLQISNMPANFADMVMPGNVTLILHPIAKAITPNWTVESIEAPSQLVDPKKARVTAVIAGHQTPAATRTVSLLVNGTVTATRRLDIPANGRATATFDTLDVPFGDSRCSIRIDPADTFPQDDTARFAVRRADPERVLFLHRPDDTRSPLYFGAALAAAAQSSFVLQPITPAQAADLDPTHYAFTVLSDIPSIPPLLETTLTRAVQAGSGVLIALGPSAARADRIPLFNTTIQQTNVYTRTPAGFTATAQTDPTFPPLQSAANWPDVKFFFAATIAPENTRTAARLADNTPLLLDKQQGEGRLLLFTSSFDNLTNDLPLHAVFVPFVEQAARYLSGATRLQGTRLVDSFLQLRNPGSQAASQVDVIAPDGRRPLSLTESATAQSLPLTQSGFYQLRFVNGRQALIAVNPDPRESDLTPIPEDVLKLWTGATGPTNTQIPNATQPNQAISPLWWYVLLCLLAVALAESILATRYLGTQPNEP